MNPKDLIPTPCHEDWNAMTGDHQRKFCGKCSTHVHDLTDYSEEEILALKVQNGGKLCGAFRLVKPLTIGVGIASLALASCQKDPARTMPTTVGIICPPAQNSEAENTKPIEVLRGKVRLPNSNVKNPNSENLLKTNQPISSPSIEKKVIPHEFLILGEITQPEVKPTEP
jgi:hypothetical protein